MGKMEKKIVRLDFLKSLRSISLQQKELYKPCDISLSGLSRQILLSHCVFSSLSVACCQDPVDTKAYEKQNVSRWLNF